MKPRTCLVCGETLGEGNVFSLAYIQRRQTTQIVEHDLYFHENCFFTGVTEDVKKKVKRHIMKNPD